MTRLAFTQWAKPLRWLDKRPLLATIEPYRLANFHGVSRRGPVQRRAVRAREEELEERGRDDRRLAGGQ